MYRMRASIRSRAKEFRGGSKRSEAKKEATLFVFYEPGESELYWTYSYPKSWDYVGGGHTNPLLSGGGMETTYDYSSEEQFSGPVADREKPRRMLQKQLDSLKTKKVIKKFKIRSSYSP